MITSEAGRELIEQFEGLRLNAYKDQRGIWTIGYGHTGPNVVQGLTITSAEADSFLAADLRIAELAVSHLVTVPLGQNQFDSLVSFTYNVGQGNLDHSTLLRLLNKGDYAGAADAMVTVDEAGNYHGWVYTNGEVNPGLVRRRLAEKKLFLEAA